MGWKNELSSPQGIQPANPECGMLCRTMDIVPLTINDTEKKKEKILNQDTQET